MLRSIVQDSVIITNNEKRVESLIEETTQTKDQTSISSIQQSNRPPSFMQLQSLVAKANNIQEASSDATPIVKPRLFRRSIQKSSSLVRKVSHRLALILANYIMDGTIMLQ